MALIDGNSRRIFLAKQSAKGTPNTTPTHVFELSGDGALNPNREIITLPETDASSQRANSRVVGASPGGGWTSWVRATQMKLLAEGIMGSAAGTPTSTATPTKTLPYYTAFDVIPAVQCTQYNDCRFSSLQLSGESMQGISASVQLVALEALLNATPPTLASPVDISYAYPFVKVTIGAAWPKTHDAFDITINRNVTILRGDSFGLTAFDSFPGLFDVSGTFRKIYETDDDYNKVHGGSAAATALTTTIFSESLSLLMEETAATKSIELTSTAIEYTQITVPVNLDGSPILQTLSFNTQRQATWANNLTIITRHP